ncbi:Amiloride-sensitive sodium channel [Popillia japonica]|uniref:Amiloride-sensitive sodium channel n=1 Tax=Popillia japonica TaxID=7064 RepID=A0AAW1JYQ9_POPJA
MSESKQSKDVSKMVAPKTHTLVEDVLVEDGLSKPKKKYPSFWQNLNDYFSEYADSTGLHGFKYLGDQKRNFIERAFWFVIIIICLYLSADMIMQTYVKWDNFPVIVTFAQSPTPIGNQMGQLPCNSHLRPITHANW